MKHLTNMYMYITILFNFEHFDLKLVKCWGNFYLKWRQNIYFFWRENGALFRHQKPEIETPELFQILKNTELPINQKLKLFDILVGSILKLLLQGMGLPPSNRHRNNSYPIFKTYIGSKKVNKYSCTIRRTIGRVPLYIYRKNIIS